MTDENEVLDADGILSNIGSALDSIDEGEIIARIHNGLCGRKVRYIGDSMWEYTGEDDNERV